MTSPSPIGGRRLSRNALLAPWRQPWPWVSFGLLILCSRTEPPRLWFWLALLLISLLVGLIQALARKS